MIYYLIFIQVDDYFLTTPSLFYAGYHNELFLSSKKRLCNFRNCDYEQGFITYDDAYFFLNSNLDWINERFNAPVTTIKRVETYSTSLTVLRSALPVL